MGAGASAGDVDGTTITGSDGTTIGNVTDSLKANVTNTVAISAATLPLPTGAATSALQTTGNTSLSSIDTKTPPLGQTTMAASQPVTIASNQTAVPVTMGVTTSLYRQSYLKNAGSNNMVVNGSLATPVNFDYTPVAATSEYITDFAIFILDLGTIDPNEFGTNPGLTNGLTIKVRTKGTEYNLIVDPIKTNVDLTVLGNTDIAGPTPLGWLNTEDWFIARFSFDDQPIVLEASTSDYFRIQVRDNLTGIDFLRSTIRTRRII